jgi:hypothetical protein
LIPTTPSAMNLVATAEVNGVNEMGKMSIAKFLTVCDHSTPTRCLLIVEYCLDLVLSESAAPFQGRHESESIRVRHRESPIDFVEETQFVMDFWPSLATGETWSKSGDYTVCGVNAENRRGR